VNNRQLNIVLKDLKEVYDILNTHKISLFPNEGAIKLEIDQINDEEKISWQNKLQKHYFACGCKEGSLTSIFFVIIYWTYIMFFEGISVIMNLEFWVLTVLFFIAGATIGKVVGLIYSKYALNIAVRKLILSISEKNH
jgi:hypothetical protein